MFLIFFILSLVDCQVRTKNFAPYFASALEDQVLEFDAFDINTMIEYRNYYLPEVIIFDQEDDYDLTVEGLDNNFMMFDKSMNKFNF